MPAHALYTATRGSSARPRPRSINRSTSSATASRRPAGYEPKTPAYALDTQHTQHSMRTCWLPETPPDARGRALTIGGACLLLATAAAAAPCLFGGENTSERGLTSGQRNRQQQLDLSTVVAPQTKASTPSRGRSIASLGHANAVRSFARRRRRRRLATPAARQRTGPLWHVRRVGTGLGRGLASSPAVAAARLETRDSLKR